MFYIIQSLGSGKYYIGSTENLEKRIIYHNNNSNKSTRNKGPWKLIFSETLPTKSLALRRELQIKSYKSGNSFKQLISDAPR